MPHTNAHPYADFDELSVDRPGDGIVRITLDAPGLNAVNAAAHAQIAGQVLLYDGDPNADWYSWGVLLVHAPPEISSATATLLSPNGRTQALPPLRFENGEAHAWIVSEDLSSFDRLTITAADGSVLATARIDYV